ncbi:carboxypeptidase-like regulatory domain-containing protein [Prolixibacter denitrificans]|uniref:Carboxypeptidase family protein n=2 Tax=Prolixibacter denitrificans TaxID=1541063 RepID=A0A2P8C6F6_9BACT|nr:carboxypeptidase-like regulatory domain-containing protein [Prolixibacter denitrificans]PSK80517.1 carboxypeptidase family protein [Prolixibacter denitrificans]
MDNVKRGKTSMYQVTYDYLTANREKMDSMPNFPVYYDELGVDISKLLGFAAVETTNLTGISNRKNELKMVVAQNAYDLSTRIFAYAEQSNLVELQKDSYYPESVLKYGTDAFVRDNSRKLYNLAQANLENLAAFGVTAETQATFLANIDQFEKAIPLKRDSVSERVKRNKAYDAVMVQTDAVLKKIDSLAVTLRLSDPDFYAGYKSSRKIIDTGTASLSVKGQVVEVGSLVPVPDAFVELMPLPLNGDTPLKKKTADKGGFRIKSMTPGNYQVKVSKYGYTEQVLDVAVNSGETTKLTITLAKN